MPPKKGPMETKKSPRRKAPVKQIGIIQKLSLSAEQQETLRQSASRPRNFRGIRPDPIQELQQRIADLEKRNRALITRVKKLENQMGGLVVRHMVLR